MFFTLNKLIYMIMTTCHHSAQQVSHGSQAPWHPLPRTGLWLTADLKIKNQFSGQEDTGRIYIIYIMGYIIRQRCIVYILYCLIHRTQINVVCNYQQSHNCCRVMPLVLLRSGASLDTYILFIYSI